MEEERIKKEITYLQLDTVLFIVCKGRRKQKMERWRNGGCLGVQ